jgi:hypothetical protein
MRKLLACIAASAVLCSAAWAHPAPPPPSAAATLPVTPEKLALARRMMDLERGGLDQGAVLRRAVVMASALFKIPEDPELLKSFEQAYAESATELEAMRKTGAEVYAKNYTEEELKAAVDYLTSPIGQAIHRKRLASLPYPPADLTPEEKAADMAFNESAVGLSMNAKKMQVVMEVAMAGMETNSLIIDRAVEIHCRRTGKCPKKERPNG